MDVYHMQGSLKSLIETVKNEAINVNDNVDGSLGNINIMNNNIEDASARTEELAANMEETAACSDKLLEFVSTDVYNDYKTMLDVADKYSDDANFVENLVTEFSSTSEELLASIQDVLKTIDEVAQAATDGAGGTTDIAQRITDITSKSNDVLELTKKSQDSSEKLKQEILRFKI